MIPENITFEDIALEDLKNNNFVILIIQVSRNFPLRIWFWSNKN